ncbi:HIT family protein [Lentzea jiangxiensis]|uniref:Diadenosine tetraphosphate (Ap4A) hydrolase n=1 Tax=Lentzea jiangxiensis TaxID=641025 RepID=A0A1H0NK18_9PSEU|nr:histidine triad (HIT) protein [Lentzea jiangxiensis]SDO92971.1 Diadenosine tetraphosphate (Ap4A) hydrolase [Lentzea jiangxiensis]
MAEKSGNGAFQPAGDCPVCAKHRGEGPLAGPVVFAGDLVVVSHQPRGVLGHLFVETRRHVASLDLLTVAEAEAVARAARLTAVGLRAELDPEFVFSAVVGRSAAHFHQHVFVRHRGTPDELPWTETDWPGAPRGDAVELSARLGAYFEGT